MISIGCPIREHFYNEIYYIVFHLSKFWDESEGFLEWNRGRQKGNTRKGYRAVAHSVILQNTINDKRLAQAGYFDILAKYESLLLD